MTQPRLREPDQGRLRQGEHDEQERAAVPLQAQREADQGGDRRLDKVAAPPAPPAKPKPPGEKGGGQQRMVRRDLLKFRWSLECPGCGFKVTGDGQPQPGQRLARCGRCKLVLVLGGG